MFTISVSVSINILVGGNVCFTKKKWFSFFYVWLGWAYCIV